MERHVLTADRGDAGVRLDLVLLRYVRKRLALSRRRLQAAIEAGRVNVNGVVATKTAARVAAGDRIEAWLPAPRRREAPRPEPLALDVLFEDEHLLAVNKSAGIVVHPSYKHMQGTLLNAVLWHLRECGAHPRLLQRLDKDTSGVVLVSKTKPAHAAIVRAMRAGTMRKEYLAIVRGVPRPAHGTIALKLRRDPSDLRRVAVAESEGKESVTRYETLSVSGQRARPRTSDDVHQATDSTPDSGHRTPDDAGKSPNPTSDLGPRTSDDVCASRVSLLRCELVTGRMHQIRVHLAARGWPIVGDRVYRAGRADRAGGAGGGDSPRQALHAWRVSLPHPATGAPLIIVAPVPDDMRALASGSGLQAPAD